MRNPYGPIASRKRDVFYCILDHPQHVIPSHSNHAMQFVLSMFDKVCAGIAVHCDIFSIVCGLGLVSFLIFVLYIKHMTLVWLSAVGERNY